MISQHRGAKVAAGIFDNAGQDRQRSFDVPQCGRYTTRGGTNVLNERCRTNTSLLEFLSGFVLAIQSDQFGSVALKPQSDRLEFLRNPGNLRKVLRRV